MLKQALLDWRDGLGQLGLLLQHPLSTLSAVVKLPGVLREAIRVLRELHGGEGILVLTPASNPILVSRLSGFGNVTLQIAKSAALTPELVLEHEQTLRAKLLPINHAAELGAPALATLTYVPLTVGTVSTLCNLNAETIMVPIMHASLTLLSSVGLPAALRGTARWALKRMSAKLFGN